MSKGLSGDDAFGRRTRREPEEIDFTSLIDVVFLLLIFFMYASAVVTTREIDTPAAKHGVGVDPTQSTIITIYASDVEGAEPQFVLGDASGEKGSIDEVKHFIEQGRTEGHIQVMVKAEKKVPHRFVHEVAQLVTELDAGALMIAVQEAPE